MIAFVLSGAGARGPLQIGALQALLEAGIRPDLLVGTSAGAINCAYVAASGFSAETLAAMHLQWKQASAKAVYPGNLMTAAWRLVRGEASLFPNSGLRKLIRMGLPDDVRVYRDLKMPLYVVTVDLLSSRLFLFGEDARAPIVESVAASATIPGIHPPVDYHGLMLVDGGVLANVAVSVAMDKGATQVYALNASYAGESAPPPKGIVEILNQTLTTMMAQSLLEDLARADAETTVDLHHILLRPPMPMTMGDFGHADELAQAGYLATQAYLANPAPRAAAPPNAGRSDLGEIAPGVREYRPSYWMR
jgi:NTE family protein